MASVMTRRRRRSLSIWDDPLTGLVQRLAYEGFTHATIAKLTDCSGPTVAYRLGRLGVSTSEVRRGETHEAKLRAQRILERYDHRIR